MKTFTLDPSFIGLITTGNLSFFSTLIKKFLLFMKLLLNLNLMKLGVRILFFK